MLYGTRLNNGFNWHDSRGYRNVVVLNDNADNRNANLNDRRNRWNRNYRFVALATLFV